MDSPVSTFLYTCLVWSLVKYWPTVGQLSSLGPPVLKSNGKKFKGLLLSSSELCAWKDLYVLALPYLTYAVGALSLSPL